MRQHRLEVSALAVHISQGPGPGQGQEQGQEQEQGKGQGQGQGASVLLGRGKYSAVYKAHIQCLCDGDEPDDDEGGGGGGEGSHTPPLLGASAPEPHYDRWPPLVLFLYITPLLSYQIILLLTNPIHSFLARQDRDTLVALKAILVL